MPHQLTFLSLLQCTGKLKYVQQWQRIEKKVLRSINIPSAEIDKPEHFLWKYELFFRRGRSAPILNRRRRLGQLRHESAFLTIEKTDVPQVGNDFQNTHTEKQIVVSLASPFPRKNCITEMQMCDSIFAFLDVLGSRADDHFSLFGQSGTGRDQMMWPFKLTYPLRLMHWRV